MRTILHSDLNNFYASVECLYDPSLKGRPMAVCGDPKARHGIVLAKNMPAKRAGVQTGEAVWQAVRKCPGLVIVPPDHSKYLRFSKLMRNIYADYTDAIEPYGLDECWLDISERGLSGEAVADELRRRAREELGLTVSVGVSFNKVFAKLGSDMKKPDGTTVISRENFREKVWPLPAGDLLYVGPATRRKLLKRNIITIGDIARCAPEELRQALGSGGEMLWSFANGLDESPVEAAGEDSIKSIGNSTTTPRDIADEADAHRVLVALSESVAERLRKHGMQGRVVCLSGRDVDLNGFSCQRHLAEATALASEICACARQLLRERFGWEKPLRSLGVSVSALEPSDENVQLSMFPDRQRERRYAAERAVSDIRGRFGREALQRASVMAGGAAHVSRLEDD